MNFAPCSAKEPKAAIMFASTGRMAAAISLAPRTISATPDLAAGEAISAKASFRAEFQ